MICAVRVAILVEQLLAPVPGGTGRFAGELAAALARQTGPAETVTPWCAWHLDRSSAAMSGLPPAHRLPLGPRVLARAWERGIGPVPRGADVVLAPTLLAPPRRGRPLVATIHDAVPWTHPQSLTERGVAFHRRMAERVARDADAVLVPTRAVADALTGHLLLRPARVHVIGEGASPAVTQPPADAAARRNALGLPAAYLLTVSTLEPRKGLEVALDALALRPGLPLAVVGQPGWGDVDLASAVAARRLPADRLLVLGRLSDPDLAAVLAGAVALVAPSRAEGFCLPVLEAMTAGVPVITSDDPAMVEVGGGATDVVPVGDAAALAAACAALEVDGARRAALSAAGRRRAADFSWEATGGAVWDVLRAVVERRHL